MIARALRIATAVAGGASLAQFPAFFGQYLQRLGGRLDQAEAQVARIERAARAEGLELADYVAVFLNSGESAHRRQGSIMLEEIADLERYRAAFDTLSQAGPGARLLLFVERFDPGVAGAALSDFSPGLPLTLEGLAYAAAGLCAGWGLAMLAGRAVAARQRRRRTA